MISTKLISIFITSLLFFSNAFAWKKIEGGEIASKLLPLKFSNRAKCALDSKTPSQSAFMLLNNIDIGKTAYRLGKFTGQNPAKLTKDTIKIYRKSILELIKFINHGLISQKLPLLPEDIKRKKYHVPSRYKKIIRNCPNNQYCKELDEYISKLWCAQRGKKECLKKYKIDNFHSKDNFIRSKDLIQNKHREKFSCYKLKKFGALQSHLFGTKPNRKILGMLSESILKSDEYLTPCKEDSKLEELEVALYQFEIPSIKEDRFKKIGFDYWNSLKLYLSWAFRNSSEFETMSAPYFNIFQGVALEQSLLLIPNGCKSLSSPTCSGDYLAMNALREFSSKDFLKDALNNDLLKDIPQGPQDDIINNPAPSVNVDELDLGNFPSADKWLKNYKKNFVATRTRVKKNLLKAISFLNISYTNLPVTKLIEDINKEFENINKLEDYQKQNLYHLCAEFYFADHQTFSFIKNKLALVEKTNIIDGLAKNISKEKAQSFFNYYQNIAKQIISKCNSLKQEYIWDNNFSLNKEGYSSWYLNKVFSGKIKSKKDEILLEQVGDALPYLYYSNESLLDNTICFTASDCARKTLESTVYMYKSISYAETFFNLKQVIKSPNMANPYAERYACKSYDPWFKTKNILFNLMWDIGQAAISTTTTGLLYTKAELLPKTLISFNQMVDDGKIIFSGNYHKEKIISSISADFGPLLGVPCSVSLNAKSFEMYDLYRFVGINVGACNSEENYDLTVFSGSEMSDNKEKGHSECLSCQLNFEGIATTALHISEKIGPPFFLFRGIVRLFRALKDPHNIPRSWEINPRYLLETYRKFNGKIPKNCVSSLIKGERCLSPCENKVAKKVSENIPGTITKIVKRSRWRYKVWTSKCQTPINVVARKKEDMYQKSCFVKSISKPRCDQ